MTGLIAKVNPIVLVMIGVASLIGSMAVRSLPIALISLGAYVLAAILFVPRPKWTLICFGFSLFAAASITYSTWRLGGRDLETAFTAGLRIMVLAWPGSVAAGFIDPARLGDYLPRFLPDRMVVAFSAALQRFTSLADAWVTLDRTRRARGFAPTRNPLSVITHSAEMAFALLVHAMRDASRTAIAMDARGFGDAHERTWAEPAPWTCLDIAALCVGIALGALPVTLLSM